MSSGKEHDKASIRVALAGSIIVGIVRANPVPALLYGGGALLNLILSPDLDLPKSNAKRRWGVMGWIWWAYDSLIPHRHWASHGPVIGTAGRLFYLLLCVQVMLWSGYAASITAIANGIDWLVWAYPFAVDPAQLTQAVLDWLPFAPWVSIAWVFSGLCNADIVHLLMDQKSTADKKFERTQRNRAQ